jgi:Bacterial type II and III secretion system protein
MNTAAVYSRQRDEQLSEIPRSFAAHLRRSAWDYNSAAGWEPARQCVSVTGGVMAYFNVRSAMAAVCIAATTGSSAFAIDRPVQQVLINATILEVGVGASSASGNLGFDTGFNNEFKSFSTVRPFLGLGIETSGPSIGNTSVVVGARTQLFFEPKIFDVDFPQFGGFDVNAVAKNYFNVTPFLGLDVPLPGGPASALGSYVRLFGGATIADQKLTVEIVNGANRDLLATSNVTVSPTVGLEIVSNVIIPAGQTATLGGLDVRLAAKTQVTFPQDVPGLGDVPFLGGVFRQERDPEVSGQLMILVTPRIVKSDN